MLINGNVRPHQLEVQVLMGSLCPDAIRFVQNQVYPLYPHIKDYVDFTFIPFGKAYSVHIEHPHIVKEILLS